MQTINRNNYEEFFLLYVDGELDAAQQHAVENFVQQNPDLTVELEMLVHTKLIPENISFNNKEGLLRTEGHNINETNYEEFFLLYIDNELSAAKREEVEKYVLQHPKLQDEFITLKQAVLAPEIISYGNKEDLYRTEKRRIVYLKTLYWAAAAVFIGLCGVGIWMMQSTNSNNIRQPVAVNKPAQTKQPTQNTLIEKPVTTDSIKEEVKQEPVIAEKALPEKTGKETIAKTTHVKKKKADSVTHSSEDDIIQNKQDEVAYQPPVIKRSTNNNAARQLKEPPVDKNDVATGLQPTFNHQQNDVTALQAPAEDDGKLQNGYKVYQVAYKEINTNDEDRSLRIGMLDLNKDKVKGFFKKAGRLFSKSNNNETEDGKLQVANFEIDTKKQ